MPFKTLDIKHWKTLIFESTRNKTWTLPLPQFTAWRKFPGHDARKGKLGRSSSVFRSRRDRWESREVQVARVRVVVSLGYRNRSAGLRCPIWNRPEVQIRVSSRGVEKNLLSSSSWRLLAFFDLWLHLSALSTSPSLGLFYLPSSLPQTLVLAYRAHPGNSM